METTVGGAAAGHYLDGGSLPPDSPARKEDAVASKLSGLLAALLLLATVATGESRPSAAAPAAPPAGAIAESLDRALGGATPARTGAIEGVLRVPVRPRRRTVNRYGGEPKVSSVQEIPAVVYLAGKIGPAPSPASGAAMAQSDTTFAPPLLVVPLETTVEFPNEDPFFHNVFSYSAAARFDLGRYPQGSSKEVTFAEPGLVKVYCEVHESMRAAIVVVENAYWASPAEDGSFRIEGVPEGTYTAVAWHADHGKVERQVTVRAAETTRLELEL